MTKKGLGRGLQALIPPLENSPEGVQEISLKNIFVNPHQPRRKFDTNKLNELADSIKLHGVVQPIVLRKSSDNKYEIVAGERRFRACEMCGLSAIPAIVKDYTDAQMAEIALIENIQREDLDPIEEALAYRTLLEKFKFTQESLAERIGKSRSAVANMLRLLGLPQQIQQFISEGKLSVGHAKVLMAITEPSLLVLAAERVVRTGCSVRETEAMVKNISEKLDQKPVQEKIKDKDTEPDPIIKQIEDRLRSMLKTQVKVKSSADYKGKIEIEYYSKEELSQIVDILMGCLD